MIETAATAVPTSTSRVSRPAHTDGRAQVRVVSEPKPLAYMAVASLLPRRTESTSRAKP